MQRRFVDNQIRLAVSPVQRVISSEVERFVYTEDAGSSNLSSPTRIRERKAALSIPLDRRKFVRYSEDTAPKYGNAEKRL